MSKVRVDELATRTGSGNITVSNDLATANITTGNTSIVTGGRFISSQVSNDPWLKGVNSSNTETSYIKKDGQIYSAFGISLGGTGAANTLDDYEEGTFTPQVLNGWGVTSPTYSYNLGYYTKIGDLVYIRCQIVLSGGSINGNQLKIYGFPFTPLAIDSACTGYFSTASSNAENAFLQIVGSSTIFAFQYRTNTGLTSFDGTFAGSGFNFIMSGMYKTS